MARSKTSAVDALKRLQAQRSELDARETKLRTDAANELGKVLLECGAETIDAAKLRQLMKQTSTMLIYAAFSKPVKPYARAGGGAGLYAPASASRFDTKKRSRLCSPAGPFGLFGRSVSVDRRRVFVVVRTRLGMEVDLVRVDLAAVALDTVLVFPG